MSLTSLRGAFLLTQSLITEVKTTFRLNHRFLHDFHSVLEGMIKRLRFRWIVCWLFMIWFVFACALSISSSYPGSSLSLPLSLLSQSSVTPCFTHSLALSLRQNGLKRTYGDRKIDAQVQIKSFFMGTSHTSCSYTQASLSLERFFWECSRVTRCLSDETFTETLETHKQTDGQKKIIMQKQRPKENKRLWMCYHESTVL